MSEIDFKFKILIIGVASVGKTSLIRRYVDNTFQESYIATMLTDWSSKDVNCRGKKVRLNLVELGGQERFKPMQRRHFCGADYIAIVASVDHNERRSLKAIPTIINFSLEVWRESNSMNSVPIVIILNKLDLIRGDKREDLALYKFKNAVKKLTGGLPSNGTLFTSAKTGEGVDVLFNKISMELLRGKKGGKKNDYF